MTDVAGALLGKQQIWTPDHNYGEHLFMQGRWPGSHGVSDWILSPVDERKPVVAERRQLLMNAGQYPEATMTRKNSAFRNGAPSVSGTSRILSTPPTWKLWLDYRLPDARFLRNFSLTVETDQLEDTSFYLQYHWSFPGIKF